MLAQMTQRLLQKRTFEDAIWIILDDVIALHGAEFGNIQLLTGPDLIIVAQRGFGARFLQAFRQVGTNDDSACGKALRARAPIIIADVDQDADYARYLGHARQAGYRSVQSTPMMTRAGFLLGMISTQFVNVHEPTPIEMQTLKSYSVIAADHALGLLGDDDLAARAAAMSALLHGEMPTGDTARPSRGLPPSSLTSVP